MITRKWLTLFTISAFLLSALSCTGVRRVSLEKAQKSQEKRWKKIRIFGVDTISGARIEFPKKEKVFLGDEVTEKSTFFETLWVEKEKIIKKKTLENGRYVFKTTDGHTYEFGSVGEEDEKKALLKEVWEITVIPYSDVSHVKIKTFSAVKTILLIGGIVGIGFLVSVLFVKSTVSGIIF
jgi:hypothetical protein